MLLGAEYKLKYNIKISQIVALTFMYEKIVIFILEKPAVSINV